MGRQRGQAGIEALCALPLVTLVALLAVQVLVWGVSLVEATAAADAGARALARGDDVAAAARAALPAVLAARLSARATASGTVVVRLRAPSLVPGLPVLVLPAEAG